MSWAFDPSNWASLSHAPLYADFVTIAGDIHTWGGDVVAAGNVLRTVGAVQLLAGDLPGTAYTVSAGSWSGGTATLTIGTHHVVVGQLITVASVVPTGYNVALQPVTAVTGTTVSFAVASNPGSYTSGGTLTVGTAPQAGMIGVDGTGVLKRYFSGAWASITAASQTPWASNIDGGGFALTNVVSIVLTPAAVPTGAAGKLAVNAAKALQVHDGSAWQYTGLQDPGGNGLVKRTALNATTAAAAGTDYYAPGGTIARADLPAMVASGASHAAGIVPDPGVTAGTTKFLREDGSWAIPAATGLADPGGNGIVKRTASNTTAPATAGADYYAPGSAIAYTDLPSFTASGTGHHAGAVPDPGSSAGTAKFLREDATWATVTIDNLQGNSIDSTAPTSGQVLAWNSGTAKWTPTAPGGSSANASQLQGFNIATTTPTSGQVLTWSSINSRWEPTTSGGSQTPWTANINAASFDLGSLGNVTFSAGKSITQDAWTDATLGNSWVNFGSGYANGGYRLDKEGYVHLRGAIKSGTTTDATLLFTLPVGSRPANIMIMLAPCLAGTTPNGGMCQLLLGTDGTVRIYAAPGNGFLCFDGLTFGV